MFRRASGTRLRSSRGAVHRSGFGRSRLKALLGYGCALAALLGASCSTEDEHAILIEAESLGGLETLDVVVVDLEGRRPPTRADGRDITPPPPSGDGSGPPPVRIVVRLDRPSFVLVHLVGHAGADRYIASRCYRVDGIVRDRIVLAGPLGDDADGDSFPASAEVWCLDPPAEMPVPCDFACGQTSVSDCNDGDPAINPAAPEICENRIDENCDGGDSACADADGDSFTACRPGAPPESVCDCDDTRATVYPGAPDACNNGVDEDCRGGDAMCDRDMDNYPADRETGGTPDCDDTNPAINPGAPENPGGVCDGIDNNCNGLVDEVEDCTPSDLDRDGAMACVGGCRPDCDCNDCDPGIRPGAPESCRNGIDANGDGTAPSCASGDADRDGFASAAAGGADCNDADPTIYPGAPDRCGDGIAQGCVADHPCGTDADRDGFSSDDDCDDSDAMRNPYATTMGGVEVPERCDGVDDDCDGVVDEVLDPTRTRGCIFDARRADASCTSGFCPLDFQTDWPQHCGGCRNACSLITTDACVSGACVCRADGRECAAGDQCCSDGCKNLDSDIDNCGGCGRRASSDLAPRIDRCTSGEFTCGTGMPCGPSQICCNGACFAQFDVNHCGVCGNDCDQAGRSTVCLSGRCSCGAGGTACGGSTVSQCCGTGDGAACADLSRDPSNCGTCGTAVDIAGDPRHCGGCLQSCNPDRANLCTGGSCTCGGSGRACGGDSGDRCCPGIGCVDLRSDVANCGECGRACAVNQRCDAGRCVCQPNFQDCDSSPGCESDRRIDANHCGNCSTECRSPTPSCVAGSCRACASAADCSDDGLACTSAVTCVDSACVHPLIAGNCLIGGTCVASGATNGSNICQWCDTANPNAWTARPGLACNDNAFCTINDACNASGVCVGGAPMNCGDGLSCTTDTCIEATDSCGHTINAGFCVIDDACVAMGDRNPTNSCRECIPTMNQSDYSNRTGPCNDGMYCTDPDTCTNGTCGGPARSCNDMRSCTTDTCDEAADMCRNTIMPDRCLIGMMCFNGGAPNPSNQCQECTPAMSTTAWSNRTGSCNDGLYCTVNDACSGSMCTGAARDCEETPADLCTTDTCNEAMDRCDHGASSGCTIGAACIPSGMANPSNPCQECNPAMSTTAWSNRTGSCSDGMYCTVGETCSAGVCGGGTPRDCGDPHACTNDSCNEAMDRCENPVQSGQCLISSMCYGNNDPNPANQCQECRASTNQTAWTNRSGSCDDGMSCTSGDMCMGGMCVGGSSTCDGG